MHRVDRQPPRLDVGGADDHPIDRRAARCQLLGEDVGLEGEITAQRGVAATGDHIRDLFRVGRLVQSVDDLPVELRRIGFGKAASVGQDEEAGRTLLKRPLQISDRPAGQNRQVGDRLRTSGVVVENHQPTTGLNLIKIGTDVQLGRLISE